jgi:hypothetical protein
MELVLTEKRGGGYQAHRPTCKKMGDKEQFDAEELNREDVLAVTPCSSCKPKDEDMEAMRADEPVKEPERSPAAKVAIAAGAPAVEGDPDEDDGFWDDDLLGDSGDGTEVEIVESVDADGLEPEVLSVADREVVAPETVTDEERQALAEAHADAGTDPDEDLLGDEPATPVDPPKVPADRKPPKAAPAAPAKSKEPELKAEQAKELMTKVFNHLGLMPPENWVFPGFGKALKTEAKQTVYLNSKGTADVRANSPEQASQWVEEGLAERRGGNYVRVAVRDL